jgi:nucleoside-diphosphate-sugar epimerase
MLGAARILRVDGYDPHMQLIHFEDATRAFELAMERGLDGTYNVAPDGWTTLGALIREAGRREVVVGHAEASRRLAVLNRMSLTEWDPAAVPFLMYPWALSNDKIRTEGFSPAHTSSEALRSMLEGIGGRIRLGPVSVRPRDVVVAAAGAAAVAGGLARRRARRGGQPPA